MPEPSHADIVERLATLQANLQNCIRRVDEQAVRQEQERRDQGQHRALLRQSITELTLAITTLTGKVADITPKVETLHNSHLMAKGAGKLALLLSRAAIPIAGALGGVAGAAAAKLGLK